MLHRRLAAGATTARRGMKLKRNTSARAVPAASSDPSTSSATSAATTAASPSCAPCARSASSGGIIRLIFFCVSLPFAYSSRRPTKRTLTDLYSDILTRHELMHLATQRASNTLSRKRACTECARARERCSRDEPCLRCSAKSLQCLYPDDAGGQKARSPSQEIFLASTGNFEHGKAAEEQQQQARRSPRNFSSLLPKNEASSAFAGPGGKREEASAAAAAPFLENDASFRELLYAVRSQTSAAYPPPGPALSSDLLDFGGGTGSLSYDKSSCGSSVAGSETSSRSFVEAAGRQAPIFEQHHHDIMDLDDARFGPALGDYTHFCHTPSAAHQQQQQHQQPVRFLPINTADQQRRGSGILGDFSGGGGGSGSLSSSRRSQPINLKTYEMIASNFKEICFDYGDGSAGGNGSGSRNRSISSTSSSNNISESQRPAQHELFVKLYYEHFQQPAY
ncbi:hypothetical protein GGR52DRAFT_125015 [Hypoxylon sp. FL1284]|nr:hypothetical protein GGR52DRAFT_125015 [Hypoxylon sp. FL1284]